MMLWVLILIAHSYTGEGVAINTALEFPTEAACLEAMARVEQAEAERNKLRARIGQMFGPLMACVETRVQP